MPQRQSAMLPRRHYSLGAKMARCHGTRASAECILNDFPTKFGFSDFVENLDDTDNLDLELFIGSVTFRFVVLEDEKIAFNDLMGVVTSQS